MNDIEDKGRNGLVNQMIYLEVLVTWKLAWQAAGACRGWSAAQLQNVAGLVQLKRLPYNTVVIEQGTQADCTFFIQTGEVRVVRRMQADAQGTPFWAALHKDPLLGPKYAPTSTKHRRFDSHPKLCRH